MVRVGIYQTRPDDDPQLGWTRIATITANGHELNTEGDAEQLRQILELTVPHPHDSGQSLTRQQDPEAWANGLPAVLRGPAVIATTDNEQPAADRAASTAS